MRSRHHLARAFAYAVMLAMVVLTMRSGVLAPAPAAAQVVPTATPNPPTCGGATTPAVCLSPGAQSAATGQPVAVQIVADGVTDLGAYSAVVSWDPSILSFSSFTDGSMLGSSGRTVSCNVPIVGVADVRLSCVTLGGTPPPGVTGSGVLATLTLIPLDAGNSPLHFQSATLLHPDATPIFVQSVTDASVSVTIAPTPTITSTPTITPTPVPTETPTPCPGVCPTASATSTATNTRVATSTPTPLPTPGPVTLRFNPTTQTVPVGATAQVGIDVESAVNLGAYQVIISWDSQLFSFGAVSNGTFLGSSGRTVTCNEPLISPESVKFSCVTLGGDLPGVTGSGRLIDLQLTAIAPGSGPFTIQSASLLHPNAATLKIAAIANGAIAVDIAPTPTQTQSPTQTATPTACAGACPTTTETGTPTITSTPTITPTPSPSPTNTPVSGPIAVFVTPISPVGEVGQPITLDVAVQNVRNLGAYEFTLDFDPSVLQFSAATNGDLLGSSGREVQCAPPQILTSSVRTSCVSLGAALPGADGDGVLAHVTFIGLTAGVSPIRLRNTILLHPDATSLTVGSTAGGTVDIEIPATPTPCPGACPTATSTPTASATPTITPTSTGGSPTPTPPVNAAIVAISPVSQTVAAGNTFTVQVNIAGVVNLGSYEFTMSFDDALLDFVSVSNGPFLGSTGRSAFCPAAIRDTGSVRFGCATLGTEIAGPNGSGTLATLTFQAVNPGTSQLGLPIAALSDPLAFDIGVSTVGGDVTVTGSAAPLPAAVIGGPNGTMSGRSEGGPTGSTEVAGAAAGMLLVVLLVVAVRGDARVRRRLMVGSAATMMILTAGQLSGTLPFAGGAGALAGRVAQAANNFVDGGATVTKQPANVRMFVGGSGADVTEEVSLPPGRELGAFQLFIISDDSVVQLTVDQGDFLGSTGRATHCTESRLPNILTYACTSTGAQPGPTGTGTLAVLHVVKNPALTLKPTDGNGVIVTLNDITGDTELLDTQNVSIPVSSVTDSDVTITALEGDLNHDCIVNVKDQQLIAFRYSAFFGTLLYGNFFDLEPSPTGDGDIDIKDLQFVFGRDGLTCPEETPTPSPSPTRTPGATNTPSPTVSATATQTATSTMTPAVTSTSTPSPTATATQTATSTMTPTATSTSTPSPTATATSTSTSSPTATSSATAAATHTPATTRTPERTATAPITATRPAGTQTARPTVSATRTAVATATSTPIRTSTVSPTAVPATRTAVATATSTPVRTSTVSPTAVPATRTAVATATSTPVRTSTVSPTAVPATRTAVATATSTRPAGSPTAARTATSATGTPTRPATSPTPQRTVTPIGTPGGAEGCTPGFWKNNLAPWPATGYAPTMSFESVFGRDAFAGDPSLVDVLGLTGGGLDALSRHAVAALLNAADPNVQAVAGVDTPEEVIALWQTAFDSADAGTILATKDVFARANESGCPIDAHGRPIGQPTPTDDTPTAVTGTPTRPATSPTPQRTVTPVSTPGGAEGCTPGFWKSNLAPWPPTGYAPTMSFESVFGRDAFAGDPSLVDVLGLTGGGLDALSRHAVAALLNAADPNVQAVAGVDTPEEVIALWQTAFDSADAGTILATKDVFAGANESGCPIDAHGRSIGSAGPDSDGDGCSDADEESADHRTGGQRDPENGWDFYDVNGTGSIDLEDTIVILTHFGEPASADPAEQWLDRFVPDPGHPWRTAHATDGSGIDIEDVIASLESFGDTCSDQR